MPPLILLLVAFGIGHHVARQGVQSGPPSIRIDRDMPIFVREEVVRALQQENDPKTLSTFADSIASKFPHAAFELRAKAWVLGGRQGPLPELENAS